MKLNPDGTISTNPAEQINVTITAVNTPYQVGEPTAPCNGAWTSRTGPNPRVLAFATPGSGACALVFAFKFIPDASGTVPADAKYTVRITGGAGGDTLNRDISPPPNEQAIAFNFVVAAGLGAGR